jgi:hypothetical protein
MEEEHVQTDMSKNVKCGRKRIEIALLLVMGILVGFSVKTEAAKRITIGYGDYLLSQKDASAYDINAIQKNLLAKGTGDTKESSPQTVGGGSCGGAQL